MYQIKKKSRLDHQKDQDIKQSIMALDATLEKHKRVMAHYMKTGEYPFQEENLPSYKKRYKAMLKTTIEELEKTRRSFKSHQVEDLRKRLIQELVDIE